MTNFVAGTTTFNSDTESAAESPLTKMMWGPAGSGQRVSAAAPMPVVQQGQAATAVSLAAAAATQVVACNGMSSATLVITSVGTGGTVTVTLSPDGTNYNGANLLVNDAGGYITTITAPGVYQFTVSGFTNIKVTATALTGGTITGTLYAGPGDYMVVIDPSGPQGGANSQAVIQPKDANRNARIFMLDAYTAAPATEALQTVVQWYSNAAVAGTTTPAVVPAGKILRLTGVTMSTKSLATVGSAVLRIRANTAGVATLASPLVWSCEAGSKAGATTTAMTGATDTITFSFPDGIEFPAGTGLGFTLAGYGPTGTLTLEGVTRFVVTSYEYTA